MENKIDITYYYRCISTLEKAYDMLSNCDSKNIEYEIYRSASIKEFELILEQSSKLMRKILKPYYSSHKEVDQMYYKDHSSIHKRFQNDLSIF